uniref:DNA/RNA helicase domain-containing protein n=1 Tax=Prevotella sp. TaxID=59823 RepID=UPI00402A071D
MTWFLRDKSNINSSFYMEDVATEFQVQGIENDWVIVAWDIDFRYSEDGCKQYQ